MKLVKQNPKSRGSKLGSKKVSKSSIQINFSLSFHELNEIWSKQWKEFLMVATVIALIIIILLSDPRTAGFVTELIEIIEKITPILKFFSMLTGFVKQN